jgi:hypothetical protein
MTQDVYTEEDEQTMQRIYEGTPKDSRAELAKVFAAEELWSKLKNLQPELRNSLYDHLGEENSRLYINLVHNADFVRDLLVAWARKEQDTERDSQSIIDDGKQTARETIVKEIGEKLNGLTKDGDLAAAPGVIRTIIGKIQDAAGALKDTYEQCTIESTYAVTRTIVGLCKLLDETIDRYETLRMDVAVKSHQVKEEAIDQVAAEICRG